MRFKEAAHVKTRTDKKIEVKMLRLRSSFVYGRSTSNASFALTVSFGDLSGNKPQREKKSKKYPEIEIS